MKRRGFITLLGGVAALGGAQKQVLPAIGLLTVAVGPELPMPNFRFHGKYRGRTDIHVGILALLTFRRPLRGIRLTERYGTSGEKITPA